MVATSVVSVVGDVAVPVLFREHVAVGVIRPLSDKVQAADVCGLFGSVTVPVIFVFSYDAVGVGNSGDVVKHRFVFIQRFIQHGVCHLDEVAYRVVLVASGVAVGIGHGGNLQGGEVIGVVGGAVVWVNGLGEIAVFVVLVLPDVAASVGLAGGRGNIFIHQVAR